MDATEILTSGSAFTDITSDTAEWLVEQDFARSGAFQMAKDEGAARAMTSDAELPNVLRLYTWSPFAVSIGFQQKMDGIDLEACAQAGVDVVRRPTGGRAVYHAEELTYSVVMRERPGFGIYAMHNKIAEALLKSLSNLGLESGELQLTGRSADEEIRTKYSGTLATNAACFASTARHEITYRGRKVIGSAQRRFGNVVLQHGSILLGGEHLRLPELLAISSERKAQMRCILTSDSATLSDVFGRTIFATEAADSIRESFVAHFIS
jgi:lipoate-protein ligase A